MSEICAIIPTFNESNAISTVVKAVRAQGIDVVVIDDGSTDGTAALAKAHGALVLFNTTNMGKGACLIKGFDYAVKNGYDLCITLDGDGQHLPEEIKAFTAAAAADPSCGIIIGNRMSRRGAMPFTRVCTNKTMSWYISKMCGQPIPDTQCGYRLIRKTVLEQVDLQTSKYETESEILIKAAKKGFTIKSIPVTSVYVGERSHINPFVDTLRFIRFMLSSK